MKDITIGKKYKIYGNIFIENSGKIVMGDNFKANSGKRYNPIGGDTVLRLICAKNAELSIGNNVGISNSTIYCTTKIVIEDNVAIGGGCKIWDTDFHSLDPTIRLTALDKGVNIKTGTIHIKKNAFIGGGAVILKGVTIGENSVIGAYSLVSADVPANEIWGGNPAKFIRKL
ncbi:acyltransferase [uncultured Candidatus Kuenenia sp.]|uniref:acyltransferase n=1 Tax=uncultured Candidatus Kuenenia sp. TaxID=1048336 RepID=UPI00031DDAE1|nr:acyltransferase [uncultured Candidatus Kuenenia sp.]